MPVTVLESLRRAMKEFRHIRKFGENKRETGRDENIVLE